MGLSGAAIGTYRPQYRPLSAIRYLDANPLPTRYTLFITLLWERIWNPFFQSLALASCESTYENCSWPCLVRLNWEAPILHSGFFSTVAFRLYLWIFVQTLGSKCSSRKVQQNCVISFWFYLHLVLHACAGILMWWEIFFLHSGIWEKIWG
jgi:hypothetical protein